MQGPRRRRTSLERLLRARRPAAPRRLVRELASKCTAARPARRNTRPVLRSLFVTAAAIVGLGSVGGLGYAMTLAGDIVTKAVSHKTYAKHPKLGLVRVNAALDEYGTTTTTATTTTASTTTATTTTAATTTVVATTTVATTTAAPAPALTSSSPADGDTVTSVSSISLTANVSVTWSAVHVTKPDGTTTDLAGGSGTTIKDDFSATANGAYVVTTTMTASGRSTAVTVHFTVYNGSATMPAPPTSKSATPSTGGSLAASNSTSSVSWSPSSFDTPVTVQLDPTPQIGNGVLFGSGNIVTQLVIKNANGTVNHGPFSPPLEVVLHNVPSDFVPSYSEDGQTFIQIAKLSGTTLPSGQHQGYYRAGSDVHILTDHTTYFGALSPQNFVLAVAVSVPARVAAGHAIAAKIHLSRASSVQITLMSGGKSIVSKSVSLKKGVSTLSLGVPATLAPGTFSLVAKAGTASATKKIVVTGSTASSGGTPPPVGGKASLGALPATVAAHLAKGSAGAAVTASADEVYVVGGSGRTAVLAGSSLAKLEQIAKLPSTLASAGAVLILSQNALYVIGGEHGTKPTNQMIRINLSTGQVAVIGKFVEPLAEAAVVQLGGQSYLIGGWTGKKEASAVLDFAGPNAVSIATRLPVGVRAAAATALDGKIYVAGGQTKRGYSTAVYEVDPVAHKVKRIGVLPQGVSGGTLVARNGRLYLLGGRTADGQSATTVLRIDPKTGRVTSAGRLARPLDGGSSLSFGGNLFVVDGAGRAVYRLG